MRVDIENVRRILAEQRTVNQIPFEEIEWYENGVKREIPTEIIADWRFVGLSNTCFVDVEGWHGFRPLESEKV